MTNRMTTVETELFASDVSHPKLADVLETYLADLERGCAPSRLELMETYPELADELSPYLESLHLLHEATRASRADRLAVGGENGAPTQRIGDFRIVTEIGRGGMGIVYEAHQQSLNRRVALKILPFAAVLDPRQIARFRNEAQAAAQLHHPHIVPVFAVGQEHGVHYYAMQYVDGQSLERIIEQLRQQADQAGGKLGKEADVISTKARGAVGGSTSTFSGTSLLSSATSERSVRSSEFVRCAARLGRQAAEALEHAHQFGIIHRDVKPSNLLIDHQGKLWVTDFGLARVTAGDGVTMTGDVLGTLRYMSPEQASGEAALVDARTDVYSLGVTLYELLTLQQVCPGDDRQQLLRQIESDDPPPLRRINPAVPVDLETIVMVAMAKSRESRYPSAQALADDLQRFLSGRPTRARRPTIMERTAKWTRRHRSLVTVAAASIVLLSLVSSVGLILLAREQARTKEALYRAQTSTSAARENFQRAERHFRQARLVVDRFGVQLADRLSDFPGTEEVRRDVLTETLRYYQQFVAEAGDDPDLRHELALAHFRSAIIAAKLGASDAAIAEYERAVTLLAELVDAQVQDPALTAQIALTNNNLALLLATRGDADQAKRKYDRAIVLGRQLVAEHPHELRYANQLAEAEANLGMLFDQLGQPAAARHSLEAAVERLRRLHEAASQDEQFARHLAIALNNLSYVLRDHDPPAAAVAAHEAVEIIEPMVGRPDNASSNPLKSDLALCYNNLAALESRSGNLSSAILWHARAADLLERMVRFAPAVVRHRSDLAISLNNLGVALCRAERPADANEPFRRARDLFATLADDYPDELAYRGSLAALLNNQALALAEVGKHEDALKIYPTAIQAQRRCWEDSVGGQGRAIVQEALSRMYYNFGQSLRAVGRYDEALRVAIDRRSIWKNDGPRLIGVAAELAELDREFRDQPTIGAEASAKHADVTREVIATLRQAVQREGLAGVDLSDDRRFVYLRDDPNFREFLATELQPEGVVEE